MDRLVRATLYEGYILYPYRPSSVKNQVRWTFGGVHPRAYSAATGGNEPWSIQTECLLRAPDDCLVTVTVRFLRPVARIAAAPLPVGATVAAVDRCGLPGFHAVEALHAGDTVVRTWEEAVEDSVAVGTQPLDRLLEEPRRVAFTRPGHRDVENVHGPDGGLVGAVVRDHKPLDGEILVSAVRVNDEVARVAVVISNLTAFEPAGDGARERALRHSLVSTHAILEAVDGRWISLADPPDDLIAGASGCRNVGLWPVLVGDDDDHDDTVLASPIILEDHPRLAPESAGDLFDSTEIDEILSLRILTLTDAEKAEVRGADARAHALLERTESLSGDDLMRLHGTIRELRPVRGEGA
ncbi:MAG TPA: hypothetical protein VI316_02105 [Candidatus Dormibacteraeota bacterium]